MVDILLDDKGDLMLSEDGDIFTTDSVRQAILVRLRWIYGEWRLGPEQGFPWFEHVFIKNPDTEAIRHLIREEILKVDGVTGALVTMVEFDRAKRSINFRYEVSVGREHFLEEVMLCEQIRLDT